MILARSNMCAVKSYRYVKIAIINNGSAFHHKIFQIYSVHSYKFICRVQFIFNGGEVTDVLLTLDTA